MAANYATSQDLQNLRSEVLLLTSSMNQENNKLKNNVEEIRLSQREIQQQLANYKVQGDTGIGFYGQKAEEEGGPRGTGWSINNAGSIAAYRASKAAVSPDYYDCTNKKVTDMYGRVMPDPANQLPYWSCPGDPSSYTIEREDKVSRLAFPELNPYPMQVPFGLQI